MVVSNSILPPLFHNTQIRKKSLKWSAFWIKEERKETPVFLIFVLELVRR